MTKEDLEAAFDRVRAWSPEKQAEAVEVLVWLGEQDSAVYVLSDEERAGVLRGLDDAANGRFATQEEMDEVFGRSRDAAK
jgi:predicted transcriptional regulator